MRYNKQYMQELGEELNARFPDLHLRHADARIGGWIVYRFSKGGNTREMFSGVLSTNAEAVAWLDGFKKGADEMRKVHQI